MIISFSNIILAEGDHYDYEENWSQYENLTNINPCFNLSFEPTMLELNTTTGEAYFARFDEASELENEECFKLVIKDYEYITKSKLAYRSGLRTPEFYRPC